MATKKPNLSDLLRQEAQQNKSETTAESTTKSEATAPTQPTASDLSRMTKAQLLAHINTLADPQPASTEVPDTSEITAQNKVLAEQVNDLQKKITGQEQAIAKAETTIKSLKTDSAAKTKLEKELGQQQGLVEKLYAQIQNLESQETPAEPEEPTVNEDRALVLAKISSYQVNLRFPDQPNSSIIADDEIGWFD